MVQVHKTSPADIHRWDILALVTPLSLSVLAFALAAANS
jgi:hypothetical protein